MQITSIPLSNKNRLIEHYRNGHEAITKHFDYDPYDDFALRAEQIDKRNYDRKTLAAILYEMNKEWDAPISSLQQINRLKEDKSVAVIGGQQAGLLTGPLYSINKLISIVHLAKEQEKTLERPVIPVFWIAGEDHDLDEINHIFTLRGKDIHKHRLGNETNNKQSVSHLQIDQKEFAKWLKLAFGDLQETDYTKKLYDEINESLTLSKSYVDFFARLIYKLFPEEGIVLIDSAHEKIRNLESEFFKELIVQERNIARSVYETEQVLKQAGYSIPLDAEMDDTHLFYHDNNNERILLKKESNNWVGKNEEVELTLDEMLQIAEYEPERFSNNVVTRPLTQEYLFPTLAFVGGDGEISYWATLKKAFHAVGYSMPPVIPRMSFTYQTDRISKLLNLRVLSTSYVLNHGVENVKMNWLKSQTRPPINVLFQEASQQITETHAPLRELSQEISPDLSNEADKNLEYMMSNLEYLQGKIERKLNEQYEQQLMQFTEISNILQPNNVLQERVWSPLPFVNEYGITFLQQLMNQNHLSIKEPHYLVKL